MQEILDQLKEMRADAERHAEASTERHIEVVQRLTKLEVLPDELKSIKSKVEDQGQFINRAKGAIAVFGTGTIVALYQSFRAKLGAS